MKKYAVCGVSNRAITMFIEPMLKNFTQQARLVALLDKDSKRFAVCKQDHPSTQGVPEYKEDEFERMVDETRPDVIIVAGRDYTQIGRASLGKLAARQSPSGTLTTTSKR